MRGEFGIDRKLRDIAPDCGAPQWPTVDDGGSRRPREAGTCLGALLHDTGHGTFLLTGDPVTDPAALAQMRLPGHESAVEVGVGVERRGDAAPVVR